MLALNNLKSSGKKRKRVGRGGSRGATSGRGFGGQKARTGAGVGPLFEGGQMPLVRRLPKRGFSNARFKKIYELVSLQQLSDAFDANSSVTHEALFEKGLIREAGALIKILANGLIDKKLTVHTHACSAAARQAVEKHGGQVLLIEEK